MSKQMTPCEKLGYKVGDKFEVLTDDDGFEIGSIVELWRDDDSICPLFRGKGCDGEYLEIYLNACQPENGVVVLDVKKVDETKNSNQQSKLWLMRFTRMVGGLMARQSSRQWMEMAIFLATAVGRSGLYRMGIGMGTPLLVGFSAL